MSSIGDVGATTEAGPPLLDELQMLIAKEKAVLEYQVLLQETEAKRWEHKYNVLVGEIEAKAQHADTPLDATEIQALIDAQDKQLQIADPLERLLTKQQESLLTTTTFDCSQITIDKPMLHRMIKHAKLFPRLRSLKLAHCGLHDALAPELLLLMQLKLDCIDVSCNDLGEAGGIAVVEGMQQAQHAPSVLLLHGNRSLASSKRFLDCFLEFCVGSCPVTIEHLTISLQDWNEMPARRRPASDDHEAIYAVEKQPLLAKQFVHALAHGFSAGATRSRTQGRTTTAKTSSAHAKPSRSTSHREASSAATTRVTSSAASTKRAQAPKIKPLSNLTSLGLRDSRITKDTLDSLSLLIGDRNTSLTALDLTWSLCGDAGAQALAKAMKLSECSLTQLNLLGCSIEHRGVTALAEALAVNRTLTLLDLRRNNPTDDGAYALVNAVARSRVLKHLDLRGCLFSVVTSNMCAHASTRHEATILTDSSPTRQSCLLPWIGFRLQNGLGIRQVQRDRDVEIFSISSRVLSESLPGLSSSSIIQLSWQWKLRSHSSEELLWSVQLYDQATKTKRHLWRKTANSSEELDTHTCMLDCSRIPQDTDMAVVIFACVTSSLVALQASGRSTFSLVAGNLHAQICSKGGDLELYNDHDNPNTAPNTVLTTWLNGGFTDVGGQPLSVFPQARSDLDILEGANWTVARQISVQLPPRIERDGRVTTMKFECRLVLPTEQLQLPGNVGYEWAVLVRSAESTHPQRMHVLHRGPSDAALGAESTINYLLWHPFSVSFPVKSGDDLLLAVRPELAVGDDLPVPYVLIRKCSLLWHVVDPTASSN